MKRIGRFWNWRTVLGGLLVAGAVMTTAQAGWFRLGGTSWKEEVRLQDDSTIVVTRLIYLHSRHEMGQKPGVSEERIIFTLPGTNHRATWVSEYSKEIGRSNLKPIALHIQSGTPYIVTVPNLCLAYNKWGRPNPPYVIFKYDGKAWQRIPLSKLPPELKEINLSIVTTDYDAERARRQPLVTTEMVKKLNNGLGIWHPEYQIILREPLPAGSYGSLVNCEELVYYKGCWVGPGDSIGKRMADRMSK